MDIGRIADDPQLQHLTEAISAGQGSVQACGLWGSSAPMAAASAARRLNRPFVYITAHLEEADQAREDLEFFLAETVELFAAWDALPGEGPGGGEIAAERVQLCNRLVGGRRLPAIVAPVQALLQPVPRQAELDRHTMRVERGKEYATDKLAAWLVDHGFERLDLVEAPGDFARRGDILDIFPPGDRHPARIEFFGDQVDSIRRFDVATQRSLEQIESFAMPVAPGAKGLDAENEGNFFDYLPSDTIIMLDGAVEIQEMGTVLRERVSDPEALFHVRDLFKRVEAFDTLYVSRLGELALPNSTTVRFDVASLSRFEGKAGEAVGELMELARDREVIVVCENDGELRRLAELVEEVGGDAATVRMVTGVVQRGFEWTATQTVILPHHELFHRQRQRRRIRRVEAVRPIESWLDLDAGDLVVHNDHGIARFREMRPMKKGPEGKKEEYLTLEFAEKAVLHVPVTQIDKVQKYIGPGHGRAPLSKLGGTRWSKTKERVEEAVAELAESLLRVQAARMTDNGVAYPEDTTWQREFEEAFPYVETEDQLIVAREIKEDLCSPRPMDRLLCGDVGYGKTELAMRAAFKVAEFGRQVAVLVPTTVLAEQHYRSFKERMAEYPFVVGCLSRFRSGSEQKKIIEETRKGRVDVLIGTHRLLSKDVGFANLGLVVIDEEQRFGVEHKERLKHLRETVDLLTMTATPIPRTLHMAMLGIRDISSLSSPPVDRRSIATQVRHWDPQLIRNGVLREMNRDGQLFFLHNRVRTIHKTADEIRRIVPECKVLVGHGQMAEGELEDVMRRFVNREADVLVATTIIESGIDIPAVNTIFIDQADLFGLAELHQLRGRVGRSDQRAYCYLLLPRNRNLTPKAARRLKSIEEFSELGAGFRIAMRDLEIRGAGNILGPEQSGHIAAVGYDMYCQLLEGAVRRLKGEADKAVAPVHLEMDVAAFVPQNYIPAERVRIDVYRRTVACRTQEELERLDADLRDAFGPPPKPVETLLSLAELRVLAHRWRITSITVAEPDIIFSIRNLALVQALFNEVPGTVRSPDPRTVHVRLRPAYFETPTLLGFLRRLLSRPLPIPEASS